MKRQLIIVSAGALGREVHNWAFHEMMAPGRYWEIKGFLDDRPGILDAYPGRAAVIASVENYEPGPNDFFVCAIGDPATKKRYVEMLDAKGARWASLIHPSAVVGTNIDNGVGCIIGPMAQMSCDIKLGKHVFFGTHSNTAHDTRYGDYAHVCGSVEVNGRAQIGEGAFLGSHATILPDATVGDWAYVGAGSVVLRRVAPGKKVFGSPAVEVWTSMEEQFRLAQEASRREGILADEQRIDKKDSNQS